jgi:hypothetical protein
VTAEAAATSMDASPRTKSEAARPLSLSSVAGTLQVVLATRRAARNEDYAYWYTGAQSM